MLRFEGTPGTFRRFFDSGFNVGVAKPDDSVIKDTVVEALVDMTEESVPEGNNVTSAQVMTRSVSLREEICWASSGVRSKPIQVPALTDVPSTSGETDPF